MRKLRDLREDYGKFTLREEDVRRDPMEQFELWINEAIDSGIEEPNAMVLSTVDPLGQPSARIVLLRALGPEGFGFFTNYHSQKGVEIDTNPRGALVFFWRELQRQVRVQGTIDKMPAEESDTYFRGRPRSSQIGAWSSPQSARIPNRERLEALVDRFNSKFPEGEVPRPGFWGGYLLRPTRIEFWQGRPSRLHDRLVFQKGKGNEWLMERLAP